MKDRCYFLIVNVFLMSLPNKKNHGPATGAGLGTMEIRYRSRERRIRFRGFRRELEKDGRPDEFSENENRIQKNKRTKCDGGGGEEEINKIKPPKYFAGDQQPQRLPSFIVYLYINGSAREFGTWRERSCHRAHFVLAPARPGTGWSLVAHVNARGGFRINDNLAVYRRSNVVVGWLVVGGGSGVYTHARHSVWQLVLQDEDKRRARHTRNYRGGRVCSSARAKRARPPRIQPERRICPDAVARAPADDARFSPPAGPRVFYCTATRTPLCSEGGRVRMWRGGGRSDRLTIIALIWFVVRGFSRTSSSSFVVGFSGNAHSSPIVARRVCLTTVLKRLFFY